MSRPPGVPDDHILGTCASCGCGTWYPAAAESVCARRGVAFLVVCQKEKCTYDAFSQMHRAGHQSGAYLDAANIVTCDDCGDDYTRSALSGGFIWHSRATCPRCADNVLKVLPTQKLIRLMSTGLHCPSDMSFGDFVRQVRNVAHDSNKETPPA